MRAMQHWMRLRVAWRMKAVPMNLRQAFPMPQDIRVQMILLNNRSFIFGAIRIVPLRKTIDLQSRYETV